ncbi:T9SS type A sorting domain-containing protein, partial [Bacteroidales bacterium OttesenSCG-928-L03]|nr:T9SS type A sorting domain-containing protein [Bacteroidales bacterium OttesenSCG-928-L03]
AGIKGVSDEFQFAFQRLIDSGSIVAKISSIDDASQDLQAGIMLRSKLDQTSSNVFLSISPNKNITLTSRGKVGIETTIVSSKETETIPCWMKLTREEDTVSAYVSNDGIAWETIGSVNLDLPRDVYVGMAVSSQDKEVVSKVQFEEMAMINQDNMKPFVRVTPLENTNKFIAPAVIPLKASATDLDGTISKVEIIVNEEIIETLTDKLSSGNISYTLKEIPVGEYSLKMKVYDDAGSSSESEEITASVSESVFRTNKGVKYDGIRFSFNNYASLSATDVYDADTIFGRANLKGATFTESGKSGSAVNLNGTNAYIQLPNNFIHQLSEFTISFFAKMTQKTSNQSWCRIFDFGSGTNSYMFFTPFVGVNSDYMKFAIKVNGAEQALTINKSFPLNKWTHIAITLKGGKLSVYQNGTEIASSTTITHRPYDLGTSTTQNYLGKSQFSSDGYFAGGIDEFRIIGRGLTSDEVKEIIKQDTDNSTVLEDIYSSESIFYPNPASDNIIIQDQKDAELTIYDMMGRIMKQQKIASINESINISDLANGIYLLNVKNKNKCYCNRLIKK